MMNRFSEVSKELEKSTETLEILKAINKLDRDIDALVNRHKVLVDLIDRSPLMEDEEKQELVDHLDQLVPWCL